MIGTVARFRLAAIHNFHQAGNCLLECFRLCGPEFHKNNGQLFSFSLGRFGEREKNRNGFVDVQTINRETRKREF